MLVSLLENAAGDLALLVAASIYRLIIFTPCLAERMAHAVCTLRQYLSVKTANSSNTIGGVPQCQHAGGHSSSNLHRCRLQASAIGQFATTDV